MTVIDHRAVERDAEVGEKRPEHAGLSQLLPYVRRHRTSLSLRAVLSVAGAATELVQPAFAPLVWTLVIVALVSRWPGRSDSPP